MPKKKTTKKVAKKATAKKTVKKSTKRTNVCLLSSDFLDGDTEIHMLGDVTDLSGPPSPMMLERLMRGVGKKLESLNLSQEELEKVDLTSLLNSMPTPKANTPKEKAQELVDTAFDVGDPKRKIEIARKALKLDPDNVDALVILAEHKSRHVFDAIAGYREAVRAGERGFGEEYFERNEGHFYAIPETRSYMRALEELAGILRGVSMQQAGFEQINQEALEIYQKMLRLNPGDNQGIRYKLLYFLLELDKDSEAEKLFADYSDDFSAWWKYGRALLDFRKGGDTAAARKSLAAAIKYNKFFPMYLLGHKRFPSAPPGHYGIGDANEAAYYMNASFTVWQKTPGAVEWIEKYFDKKK